MAKLSELSKGDRVVIARTSRYYNTGRSNPDDSVKGTVEVIGSISVSVRWDNGEINGYKDHDLDKIFISSSGGTSELTRSPIIGKWYTNPKWSKGSLAKFRKLEYGDEFGYSESMYPGDSTTSKSSSSWSLGNGVRLATESELRTLPKSHPDHPDKSLPSDKRGTPIGSYTPKTGDKVRIVANRSGSSNKIGDIGIVGNDYNTNCVVDVDGRSRGGNSHYYDDLEFISSRDTDFKVMPKTFNFKEGDRVKIIANTNSHDFSIGAIGIIKGTKDTASRGGYYWCVDGVTKRVSRNAVRECDMELVTDSYEAPKLPSIDFLAYSLKETYLPEDVVSVRIVKIPRDEIKGWASSTVDKVCKIPLGTIMTVRGKNINDGGSLIPNDNYYSFNFPRDWFQVLGIHERDMPSTTRSSAVLDPVTGHAKVWRIKTQQEMISEGLISSGRIRPSSWNSFGAMDQYFGYIVPSHMYPDIEKASSTTYAISIGTWKFSKSHFTTKPIPWDTSVVKHFIDSDDDEEKSEYDDPDDGVSWFDSSEEEVLDKLDKMSKGEAKEVWFEESPKSFWDDYTPPTKRPKLEVEIIPHRSRQIFKYQDYGENSL